MAGRQVLCRMRFQAYDWRNELEVESPTGVRLVVYCNGRWQEMTPTLAEVVTQVIECSRYRHVWVAVVLSVQLMEEIARLANYRKRSE